MDEILLKIKKNQTINKVVLTITTIIYYIAAIVFIILFSKFSKDGTANNALFGWMVCAVALAILAELTCLIKLSHREPEKIIFEYISSRNNHTEETIDRYSFADEFKKAIRGNDTRRDVFSQPNIVPCRPKLSIKGDSFYASECPISVASTKSKNRKLSIIFDYKSVIKFAYIHQKHSNYLKLMDLNKMEYDGNMIYIGNDSYKNKVINIYKALTEHFKEADYFVSVNNGKVIISFENPYIFEYKKEKNSSDYLVEFEDLLKKINEEKEYITNVLNENECNLFDELYN